VCTLLLPAVCVLCSLMPQVCWEQQGMSVSVVCSYWLTVYCPAYLFTHSAVVRPVRVGKGRGGGKCHIVETLSFYLLTRLTLIDCFSELFYVLQGHSISQCQPRPVLLVLQTKFRNPGSGSAQKPLCDLADIATHLLSSVAENYPIRIIEMR